MSTVKTTKIDGDVSVGRNVALGGKATVAGNVTVGHNLKVEGWLEAPNIKDTNKGLFATSTALAAAYPSPKVGWWALVGDSSPFAVYRCETKGTWTAVSGGTATVTADINIENGIVGWVLIESTSDLPEDPTLEQQNKCYLLQTTLYVYVGTGGDTLSGKYQSIDIGGVPGEPGEDGVGFDSIAAHSPVDGTAIITLTNGDTITLNLSHNHSALVATGEIDRIKFHMCEDETEYTGISTKDANTLYLIPESST